MTQDLFLVRMPALVFIPIKRVSVEVFSENLLNTNIWIIRTPWRVTVVSELSGLHRNL